MPLLRILVLAAGAALAFAELSADAASLCSQEEGLSEDGASAVLLLQQEMRLQSRDRVAVAVDPEGLEVVQGDFAVVVGAVASDAVAGEAAVSGSTAGSSTVGGAPSGFAAAVVAAAADAAELQQQVQANAGASAVRVEELPMASFSLLETSHGSGSSVVVRSYAAVGKTGKLLSTHGAEVVSFILIVSFILLVATLLTCLVATVPGSQDQAQAERLLRGAENLKQRQAGVVQRQVSVPLHTELNKPQQASVAQRQTSTPATTCPPPPAQLGNPPPICPTLILPHTEARFMVAMDGLAQMTTTGQLALLGTSGRKLLSATITSAEDGRRSCAISSVGAEDDPRTRAVTSGSGIGLEVFGPQGELYGTLQNTSSSGTCLARNGKPVMAIECSNRADLVITASTMEGRVLASAGRNLAPGRGGGGGDFWRLQVKADVDAVLVATCMLSRIILLPWE